MYLFIDGLFTYYPKHSGRFDQLSDRLLRFKKGYEFEMGFLKCMLRDWLLKEIDRPTMLCTIPSSDPQKVNSISKIVAELCKENELWLDGTAMVRKRYQTPTVCCGYTRHFGRFVNSFNISEAIKGHHVLLLDDVSTTGKSMMVVHDLMMDLLPTSIYCLALGKTAPP